jgi:hypothetical protein
VIRRTGEIADLNLKMQPLLFGGKAEGMKQGLKYTTSKCIIADLVGQIRKEISQIDEGAPARAEGEEKRDNPQGL